jgi:pimeloyl-ACP methyl ester carboxylesterase
MPIANIRGVNINYEILGDAGLWIALSPGGRRAMDQVKPLAAKVAAAGYRVLLHDRRNCGASDVVIDGTDTEFEIWADDLHELLTQLGAIPAVIGGGSSGCRLSITYALRHPESVRGLLLWKVTGGPYPACELAESYYGQYIRAARDGGMQAVCDMEHFRERIAENPANRERLLKMSVERFIAVMKNWEDRLLAGADLPVIGASEQDLRSITVPTLVFPGNDRIHRLEVGRQVQQMFPNSERHELFDRDEDVDTVPPEMWAARDDETAKVFVDFLRRKLS